MADWDFKHLLFTLIMFALIATLFITGVQYQAASYNKDTSGILGGALSLEPFNDSIASIESTAQTMRTTFEEQSFWSALAGVAVTGLFDLAKTMINLILTPFELLGGLLTMLGVPKIVISVILGIMIMAIIFGIWEVITTTT